MMTPKHNLFVVSVLFIGLVILVVCSIGALIVSNDPAKWLMVLGIAACFYAGRVAVDLIVESRREMKKEKEDARTD